MLLLYREARKSETERAISTFHYASTLSDPEQPKDIDEWHLHSIMLLLYLFMWMEMFLRFPDLHSIMLLLYLDNLTFRAAFLSNLHSIMLLLYPRRTGTYRRRLRIYIPLCFYFIFAELFDIKVGFQSTFHYASTLSLQPSRLQRYKQIYIPLCFYFIPAWSLPLRSPPSSTFHYASTLSADYFGVDIKYFYLHSIMLLLYPLHWTLFPLPFQIYIPLCFYFIGYPVHALPHLRGIYIPLCFYFITVSLSSPFVSILSTFHYASTLSLLHLGITVHTSLSTFHYASTLSKRKNTALCSGWIYIPLCFYFIGKARADGAPVIPSTFHYASTLSIHARPRNNKHTNLHSIMLLLYRYLASGSDVKVLIYIPLCFYFIYTCAAA